jgi:branched-chain amino acid transport system ATP-binding protein
MLLEVKDITLKYGEAIALDSVSLEVVEGSCVTVIGANGAGKSSLIQAISGMVPLAGGEIWFSGKRVDEMAAHEIVKLGIAQVPEGRRLFPDLTVLENLKLGSSVRKDKMVIIKDLEEVIGRFPILRARSNQKAGTLSGGEQQMLAIGRGLMARPKLLLMDEPSLGLAPKLVDELVPLIKNINQQGISILLSEQNVSLAFGASSRGYLMQLGKVILEGEIHELEKSEIVKGAYLGGLSSHRKRKRSGKGAGAVVTF